MSDTTTGITEAMAALKEQMMAHPGCSAAQGVVSTAKFLPIDVAIEALANLFVMAAADARRAQAQLAAINKISNPNT